MKNDNLAIKEIERVYEQRDYQQGILLLEFKIYYPYNETVKLSYMLDGCNIGSLPIQQTITNKPYKNKKLHKLSGKVGKKVCKVGLPIIERIDILNQVEALTLFIEAHNQSIQLTIPLTLNLTYDKPYTYLQCSIMTEIIASLNRESEVQLIIQDAKTYKANVLFIRTKCTCGISDKYMAELIEEEGDWRVLKVKENIELISLSDFPDEIAYANGIFKE